MTTKDALVILTRYHDPSRASAIDRALSLASLFGVPIAAISNRRSLSERAKSLTQHGIGAAATDVNTDGRAIGDVRTEQIETRRANVLVMGAYRHSCFREFILGGTTRGILTKPPIPALFSH